MENGVDGAGVAVPLCQMLMLPLRVFPHHGLLRCPCLAVGKMQTAWVGGVIERKRVEIGSILVRHGEFPKAWVTQISS